MENCFASTIADLRREVEELRAENYKLRRAHELLLSFNWKPLWYDRNVGVEGIVETMLNYSRTALGVVPLWDGFRRKTESVESLISKVEKKDRAYPPYHIKKAAENGCPDKAEPSAVVVPPYPCRGFQLAGKHDHGPDILCGDWRKYGEVEPTDEDLHLVVPLNPEGQEAFRAAAERFQEAFRAAAERFIEKEERPCRGERAIPRSCGSEKCGCK